MTQEPPSEFIPTASGIQRSASRRTQDVNDRPVPVWSGVPVRGWAGLAAVVATALEAVESVQAVQDVLHRPDLRVGQGPRCRPPGLVSSEKTTIHRICVGQGVVGCRVGVVTHEGYCLLSRTSIPFETV